MDPSRAFWDSLFLLYDHRCAAGYQRERSFFRSFAVACHPCRGSGNDIVCPVFLGSDRWEAKGAGSEPSERRGSHRSGGKAMEYVLRLVSAFCVDFCHVSSGVSGGLSGFFCL